MGFFLGLGSKIKLVLAGIAGLAVIIGMAVLKGQSMQKVKDDRDNLNRRLDSLKEKQEVQKDVQSRTDDDLIDGITRRK